MKDVLQQEFHYNEAESSQLIDKINNLLATHSPQETWKLLSTEYLTPNHPFKLHQFIYATCYPRWQEHPETAPAWIPSASDIAQSNLGHWMKEINVTTRNEFHQWTVTNYVNYWDTAIKKLDIVFKSPYTQIAKIENGIEKISWLPNATMNIVDSCFNAAPEKTALVYSDQHGLHTLSFKELNQLSNQIANGLSALGFAKGDPIAIDMPMTKEAVAIYLGIIKIGAIVVSIADSFSAEEIATRLRITQAKGIFTQDYIARGDKKLPLYAKVMAANAPQAIVITTDSNIERNHDIAWRDFLSTNTEFNSVACSPMDACNILFSSGTTGDPKAIVWNHTTPIKVGADAYLHQDIKPNDILAWPTNLGWMMGPWLLFAAFLNQAAVALYHDIPRDAGFGKFIADAKVTMLGVVPTLVATWRQSNCMPGLDWSAIKRFSSTGECSNAEDMLYLMSLAGYKPVIEYCGGTEVGGSYISSTMLDNNIPSHFSTPAMGLEFVILDENGQQTDNGEVALVPPSLGLSTQLLNADHHKVYFDNMPNVNNKLLRRHGDQIHRIANGYFCVLGRVDDTMNLGAIKVSSAEIERVLTGIDNIIETAAIAVSPPNNGPSQLVIYAATQVTLDKAATMKTMQSHINQLLNPLFKIHDVVFLKELPKTASNKIMRRVLRKQYDESYAKNN